MAEQHDDKRQTGAWASQGLTRRRFLKWTLRGLGGAAAVVSATGGGLLALRGCAPSIEGLRVLSDHQYRTLSSLARVVIPSGGAFAEGAADVDLARAFDGYLADEPEEIVSDLKLALHLVEFGPVIYDLRMTTFSNLAPEEQLAHFQEWMASDSLTRRKIATAFKKFFYLVFYDRPEVWAHLGYGGPVA